MYKVGEASFYQICLHLFIPDNPKTRIAVHINQITKSNKTSHCKLHFCSCTQSTFKFNIVQIKRTNLNPLLMFAYKTTGNAQLSLRTLRLPYSEFNNLLNSHKRNVQLAEIRIIIMNFVLTNLIVIVNIMGDPN